MSYQKFRSGTSPRTNFRSMPELPDSRVFRPQSPQNYPIYSILAIQEIEQLQDLFVN